MEKVSHSSIILSINLLIFCSFFTSLTQFQVVNAPFFSPFFLALFNTHVYLSVLQTGPFLVLYSNVSDIYTELGMVVRTFSPFNQSGSN